MTCFFKSADIDYRNKIIVPLYIPDEKKVQLYLIANEDPEILEYYEILENKITKEKIQEACKKVKSTKYFLFLKSPQEKREEAINNLKMENFNKMQKNLIEEANAEDFKLSFFDPHHGILKRVIYNLNLDQYNKTKAAIEKFKKCNKKIYNEKKEEINKFENENTEILKIYNEKKKEMDGFKKINKEILNQHKEIMENFEDYNNALENCKNFQILEEKINKIEKFIKAKDKLIEKNEFVRIFLNFLDHFKDLGMNIDAQYVGEKIENALKIKGNKDIKKIGELIPLLQLKKKEKDTNQSKYDLLNLTPISQDTKDFAKDLQGVLPFANSMCIDNLIFNAFGPIINNKNLNIDVVRQIALLYKGFLVMSGFFFFTDIHIFVEEIFGIFSEISGLDFEKIKEEDIKTLRKTFDLVKVFAPPKTTRLEAFMKFESLLNNKKFLSLFFQMNFNEPEKEGNLISLQIISNVKEVLLDIMDQIIPKENEENNKKVDEPDTMIKKIFNILEFYEKQNGDLGEFMLGVGCSLIKLARAFKNKLNKKSKKIYSKNYNDLRPEESFQIKANTVSLKSIFKILGGETSPQKKASLIFSGLKKQFKEHILTMNFLPLKNEQNAEEKGLANDLNGLSEEKKRIFFHIIKNFIKKTFKKELGEVKNLIYILKNANDNQKKIDLITNFFKVNANKISYFFEEKPNAEKLKGNLRTLALMKIFSLRVGIGIVLQKENLEEDLEKLAEKIPENESLRELENVKTLDSYFKEYIFDNIDKNTEKDDELLFRYFIADVEKNYQEEVIKGANGEKELEEKLFYKSRKFQLKKNNSKRVEDLIHNEKIDDDIIQEIVKIKTYEGFKDGNENIFLSILAYFFSFLSKKMIKKTANEMNEIIEALKKEKIANEIKVITEELEKNKDFQIEKDKFKNLFKKDSEITKTYNIFQNALDDMEEKTLDLEEKIKKLDIKDPKNIKERLEKERSILYKEILFEEDYNIKTNNKYFYNVDDDVKNKLQGFITEMRKKDAKDKEPEHFKIQSILDEIDRKFSDEELKNNKGNNKTNLRKAKEILEEIKKNKKNEISNQIENIKNYIGDVIKPKNELLKILKDDQKEILEKIMDKMETEKTNLEKEKEQQNPTINNLIAKFEKKIKGPSVEDIFQSLQKKQANRKDQDESLLRSFLPQDGLFRLFGIDGFTVKEMEEKFLTYDKSANDNSVSQLIKIFWCLADKVDHTKYEYEKKDQLIPADKNVIKSLFSEILGQESNDKEKENKDNKKDKGGGFLKTLFIVSATLFCSWGFTIILKKIMKKTIVKKVVKNKEVPKISRSEILENFINNAKLSF